MWLSISFWLAIKRFARRNLDSLILAIGKRILSGKHQKRVWNQNWGAIGRKIVNYGPNWLGKVKSNESWFWNETKRRKNGKNEPQSWLIRVKNWRIKVGNWGKRWINWKFAAKLVNAVYAREISSWRRNGNWKLEIKNNDWQFTRPKFVEKQTDKPALVPNSRIKLTAFCKFQQKYFNQ